MIRGGALLYTITVCLLIAILSGSLLLFSYFNRLELDSYSIMEKVERNAASGFNYLLKAKELTQNEKFSMDLFGTGEDSVTLQIINWGLFKIAVSDCKIKGFQASRIALVGSEMKDRVAFYLADNNQPLSLGGNTLVRGKCFLPKAGVKRAYIEGQNFVGSQLIDGVQVHSNSLIPVPAKKDLLEFTEGIQGASLNDSIIYWDEVESMDTLRNSFLNQTIVINDINIGIDNSLSGNILIKAEKSIKIEANANLQDVVVIAPFIEIDKGFRGSVQCFAKDSIKINENCTLLYPSVLAIVNPSVVKGNSIINIAEGDSIFGDIVLFNEDGIHHSSMIRIAEKAIVNGRIFSYGYIDLKGKVYGSVYTNKLTLVTRSSVYDNHLLNAIIDESRLSKFFIGSSWMSNGDMEPVKFLN